jgi:hypothetical protein
MGIIEKTRIVTIHYYGVKYFNLRIKIGKIFLLLNQGSPTFQAANSEQLTAIMEVWQGVTMDSLKFKGQATCGILLPPWTPHTVRPRRHPLRFLTFWFRSEWRQKRDKAKQMDASEKNECWMVAHHCWGCVKFSCNVNRGVSKGHERSGKVTDMNSENVTSLSHYWKQNKSLENPNILFYSNIEKASHVVSAPSTVESFEHNHLKCRLI